MLDRCLEGPGPGPGPLSIPFLPPVTYLLPSFVKSRGHEICVIKYASLDRQTDGRAGSLPRSTSLVRGGRENREGPDRQSVRPPPSSFKRPNAKDNRSRAKWEGRIPSFFPSFLPSPALVLVKLRVMLRNFCMQGFKKSWGGKPESRAACAQHE